MIVKRLEMMGIEAVESMIRPVSIKTHLPFELQPTDGRDLDTVETNLTGSGSRDGRR